MLLERPTDDDYHEPQAVSIVRLVCQTTVVLVVLIGAGTLLFFRPEYSSAAIALIGVVVGACFGLVRFQGLRRHDKT
jgi:uncharacterized YccA/Bax inhibitor family protein